MEVVGEAVEGWGRVGALVAMRLVVVWRDGKGYIRAAAVAHAKTGKGDGYVDEQN